MSPTQDAIGIDAVGSTEPYTHDLRNRINKTSTETVNEIVIASNDQGSKEGGKERGREGSKEGDTVITRGNAFTQNPEKKSDNSKEELHFHLPVPPSIDQDRLYDPEGISF